MNLKKVRTYMYMLLVFIELSARVVQELIYAMHKHITEHRSHIPQPGEDR
jgi:hypothetical protein